MAHKRPGRNEPCWCGSGQKYKRCHLARGSEGKLPHRGVADRVRKAATYEVCLHPSAQPGSCDQTVSAHTIQRARTLERLVDDAQHVLQFDPSVRTNEDLLPLRRVGWREASTFTGFCARHDAATFAPVETRPFESTPEQCFLLAYRALCHEIHSKRASLRAEPELRRLNDRGLPAAARKGRAPSDRAVRLCAG